MKIRYVIEGLLFGLIVYAGYFGWAILSGLMLTRSYVPDITERYESVEELEHKVSFGVIIEPNWLMLAGSFVLLAVLYYVVRTWAAKRSAARKNPDGR